MKLRKNKVLDVLEKFNKKAADKLRSEIENESEAEEKLIAVTKRVHKGSFKDIIKKKIDTEEV